MNRQDARPSRPSLLAGAPGQPVPAASSARILADMETRPPGGNASARALRRRWWLLGGVVVLAALGVTLLRPTDGGTAGDFHALHAARIGDIAGDLAPVAATIVDDLAPIPARESPAHEPSGGAERGGGGGPFGLLAAAAPAPTAVGDPPASGRPAVATAPPSRSNPFAPDSAIPAPAAGAASARRAPAATAPGEPALMSTLLRNIRAEDGRSAQTSELDGLVRDLESGKRAAVASDASPAGVPRTRSQQIQRNLRECPPPNTAAGLKCRQAICAVYAGRDPACPAG